METPSESVRTSILNDLENNPSIFFVMTKEKDLDAIFNKQKYTNPFIRQEGIKPPIVDHQHEDDSEDSSFYYPVDR